VFVNDWKPNFFSDLRKKVACIPFMRNIVEFTRGEHDPNYVRLTSLLHWRPDSTEIRDAELRKLYCDMFSETDKAGVGGNPLAVDLIAQAAAGCLSAAEGANFEHKVVLSIAIRLQAKKFMVDILADEEFWRSIERNQTQRLYARFRQEYESNERAIDILHRVILMTPESIHLNSFMYEPILDMSDMHLRLLYKDVQSLSAE
jgi:hypothetical protein